MNTIKRDDPRLKEFSEILDSESHHDHEIIIDEQGVFRWKSDPHVLNHIRRINLNDITLLLDLIGHGKNSEVYRKLYRDIGYSLFGYWEVFYWEVNNEDADNYNPVQIKCD